MQSNSRLATAIHALALVMIAEGEAAGRPVTSEELSVNVGAHPVHVRRVLGILREAGLVRSQAGPRGGWTLAHPPDRITLSDVYEAIDTERSLQMPEQEPDGCCRFAPRLPEVLDCCLQRAEQAMKDQLAGVTLADLLADARRQDSFDTGCWPSGPVFHHTFDGISRMTTARR